MQLPIQVLCDVPCYTDRSSLHEKEGNVFSNGRQAERINLPERQKDLLM